MPTHTLSSSESQNSRPGKNVNACKCRLAEVENLATCGRNIPVMAAASLADEQLVASGAGRLSKIRGEHFDELTNEYMY